MNLTLCPCCRVELAPHAVWCAECGSVLTPAAAPASAPAGPAPHDPDDDLDAVCPVCAGMIDDGWCARCGAAAGPLRDHYAEVPASWLGGVTDRGVRHHRNEDALAVAADPVPGSYGVLVVCDGVSSAEDSDRASLVASRAARGVLRRERPTQREEATRDEARASAMARAVRAANQAIGDALPPPDGPGGNPPSCTFVGAVVDQYRVTIANVGDSRAYWIGDDADARLLTVDDSMAQERIALGVDRETAENSPQAHAITRWLGPDAPDLEVRATTLTPPGDGWLLLCSDGLWNYATEPHQLLRLVREATLSGLHTPRDLAGHLVRWACDQGGRDNITVALARFGPRQDPATIRPAATEDRHTGQRTPPVADRDGDD